MSGPTFHLTLPDWSLFKFPPDDLPPSLPPPSDEATWRSPFPIDDDVYNKALDYRVPMTFSIVYVISVFLLNAYNRNREQKPWPISKTRAFHTFVVAHNVFLAVYSAATFYAMFRAITHTWPGLDHSGNGLAGVADALCKVHGPRGLGDAATFNTSSSLWETKNHLIKLLPEGTPDSTDVGRLWNEGLAFWGWFFYLSKFYEVVDTMIIIAKGKRSATLQTYHHAGAMWCMWAGMRYMSPPIWMFVFINSGIHAMMYTYFTLSALGIRVSGSIKRTLTTMQIMQFLFGASYAAAHLFVKYDIPIATAYTIFHPISSALSEASTKATNLAASATSVASAPYESYGAVIKRLLLRAAGEEGVAENVRDRSGQIVLEGAREAVQHYHEETRYHTDYHTINCIDTTGQSFAIWLNLFYLAPLTVLFLRFFYRSYIQRSSKPQSKSHAISRSSKEAAQKTDKKIEDTGKAVEKTIADGAKNLDEEVRKDLQRMRDNTAGGTPGKRPMSERIESFENKGKQEVNKTAEDVKKSFNTPKKDGKSIKDEAADSVDSLKDKVNQGTDAAQKKVQDLKEGAVEQGKKLQDAGEDIKNKSQDKANEIKQENNSTPATPSKKHKKKKNKKNKQPTADGAEHTDTPDHTDAGDSGEEDEDVHALKEELPKEPIVKQIAKEEA